MLHTACWHLESCHAQRQMHSMTCAEALALTFACAGGLPAPASPVTATLSPRAQGSLHTMHGHTRSTVDSLLGGDEEGYMSPLDDAFSVMSDDNPLLPAYYQVKAPGATVSSPLYSLHAAPKIAASQQPVGLRRGELASGQGADALQPCPS